MPRAQFGKEQRDRAVDAFGVADVVADVVRERPERERVLERILRVSNQLLNESPVRT